MKKGQTYCGRVVEMDFPNKGIVEVETTVADESKSQTVTETAVVKNAVKGQTVRFVVNKKRGGKVEGRLLTVEQKAEHENGKACVYGGVCGGCLYQGFAYEEQLALKEEQVLKLLGKYMKEAVYDGIKGSPKELEYRNKMEFTFGDEYKDGPLSLGLHKRGSFYDILSVEDCRINDGDFRMILSFTKDYFTKIKTPYFHRMQHTGVLRHLLVRKAAKTGEILIALVTSTEQTLELEAWKEGLRALKLQGTIAGILHILNDSLADVVQCDRQDILYGQDYFMEELLGLRFRVSAFSFFQTNSLGAEVLYETVRGYLKKEEQGGVVFDLYSGTGTIAQLLAPAARKVIGVEIVADAVAAARENAALNGLQNCEFIAGDVLKVLDEIEEKPDYIILDPPRDGVHPKALRKIINYDVQHLVYISCKPTSLARDLEMLTGCGYIPQRYCMVDMFPQTGNVETVCLLSKLHEAKHHVNVTVDMDEMDLTSAESKATYEEIKKYVAEHNDGMKVSSLNIAQVKAKYGIIERENYNKAKSEEARQPVCPKDKEEAIVEALKAFRMI